MKYFYKLTILIVFCLFSHLGFGQAYNEGYPRAINETENSIYLESSIIVKGFTAYVILEEAEPAPSLLQVAYGQDGNGNQASFYGEISLTGGFGYEIGTPNGKIVNGLVEGTNYVAYFASYNLNYEFIQPDTPTAVLFSTLAAIPPPTIVTYFPEQNEQAADTDGDIVLTFSENLAKGAGYLNIFKQGTVENPVATKQVSSSDIDVTTNVITISNVTLVPGTSYYVTIDEGFVKSASSSIDFGGISSPETWKFTTAAGPAISTLSPIDEAQSVDLDAPLIITFDESIVLGSSGTFNIKNTTGTFESITYDESNKVTVSGNTLTVLHASLDPKTEYYVTITPGFVESATTGVPFCGIDDVTVWNFTTVQQCTWQGASSNWLDPENWSEPYEDGANVIIPSGVSLPAILNSSATCNNLKIEAGGKMQVSANGSLLINGNLYLESNGADNADFAVLGNVTLGSGSDVFVQQKVTSANRSYHFASPITGLTLPDAGNNIAMKYWDNSTGKWILADATTQFELGRGYTLRGEAQTLLLNSTTFNWNEKTLNLNRSAAGKGWNFIGNPYTCSIDWDYVAKSAEMVDAFWVYDNNGRIYGAYNSSAGGVNITNSVIPPNHAFWVKVNEGYASGSLTFGDLCKTVGNGSYLKSTNAKLYPKIKLAGVYGTNKDEIIIAFADEGNTIDPVKFNTTKYFSSSDDYLQPYIADGNYSYCIFGNNAIADQEIIIPLSFTVPADDTYSINRVNITNIEDNVDVYLDDLKDVNNVVTTDLRLTQSYSFTETSGECHGRFQVRLVPGTTTSVDDRIDTSSTVFVHSVSQSIVIENLTGNSNIISIYTLTGTKIFEDLVTANTFTKRVTTDGIYLVKIKDADGNIITKKIFVK